MKLYNYSITKTGKDAFEEDHQWCIVVFETKPGVFKWWNPPNCYNNLPPYNDGLPQDYDDIEEVISDAYELKDLAAQVGALNAWGLDL